MKRKNQDESTQWALCPNCGCSFGTDKEEAKSLNGKKVECHCGHQFYLFFVDEILQFGPTAPNPCANDAATKQRNREKGLRLLN